MPRLETSYAFFSKNGFKFLVFELIIVFLGVYGAFLFQNYSEQRKTDAEREKVLVGLKQDLEYFRVYFPDFGNASITKEWRATLQQEEYLNDLYEWRFIQPQYDYIALEYALAADADVIDYEINAGIAAIYRELRKLEHVETMLNDLGMKYQSIPDGNRNDPDIQLAIQNNRLNSVRFINRYEDRESIMLRIAAMSAEQLERINEQFSPEKRKEIELELIRENVRAHSEKEVQFYLGVLKELFPNLSEEELRSALEEGNQE